MRASNELTARDGEAESLATGAHDVAVIAYPHPLKFDCIEAVVPAGQSIAEIMGRDDLPALVWSDGDLIECEHWHEVRPERHLLIKRLPSGGEVARLIGFIALAVFTAGIGTAMAGLYTTWSIAAVQATVGIVGTLALNALIPPSIPSIDGGGGNTRLNAITGQSNQVASFTPIPKVYGKPTYYPPIPMTGLPYTELVGEDQYLRMLVVLGYGPLDIGGVTAGAGESLITEATTLTGNPIKIGGTAIDQFDDVEFEIGDPDDVTLFTNTIVETTVNVALDHGTDPTTENQTITDNVSSVQTTDTDTNEISLEVFFPQLYTISGQGNTRYATVNFLVEYRATGVGSYTSLGTFAVSSIERKPLRRGARYVLPSSGQWDIRLTRVSTFYGQENSFFVDCTWTVLRSIKRNVRPFDVDNTVVMALRIRATDQLGGRIDRLSIEATSVLPVWNGSAWADAATRNPAWCYADVLAGNATRTAQAQAKLDTAELLSWASWCTTQGLYFDQVFDADGTVFDRAREVASAGLGSWHVTDTALFSIIRDQAQTPKMVVTPRNSFGFSTEYAFHRLPHALRVQFIDPDRWEPTERIVYDDGYDATGSGDNDPATRFEQIQTVGVWDADQAWKLGRYHLAQLRLRPETYSWGQDIQHLAYTRGDTVELSHDVILVGLKWGRIKSITTNGSGQVTSAVVDELLLMEGGTSYALKIQRQDGSIITEAITTVSPSTQTVTFSTAIAQHDYGSGNDTGIKVGDHFTFGESGSESLEVKITRIEPQGDFKAGITAVPAAEDIFDAWTGTIPTFDPVITEPIDPALLPPVPPAIVSVRSESPPSPVGAPQLRMAVGFSMPPGLAGVTVEARVRVTETIGGSAVLTAWRLAGSAPSDSGVIYVNDVEETLTFQVQIRSRRGYRISGWTATVEHTIGDSGWTSEAGATVNNLTSGTATPTGGVSGDLYFETDENQWWSNIGGTWTRTATVGAASGEVTVRNPNFEAGDVQWTKFTGWAIGEYGFAHQGTFSARCNETDGTTQHIENSVNYPCEAGDRFLAGGYLYPTGAYSGGATYWRVRFLQSDGTTSISLAPGNDVSATASAWSLSRVVAVAPTGAHFVRLEAVVLTQTAGEVFADDGFLTPIPRNADIDALLTTNGPADAGATDGADLGTNVRNAAGDVLADIDVRNDQLVTAALSALNANPSMQQTRRTAAGGLAPASWFGWGSSGYPRYVSDATRDELEIAGPSGLAVSNAAFRVNPDTEYEFSALVKMESGTGEILIRAYELDTDLTTGKRAIGSISGAGVESEIIEATRFQNVLVSAALTTGYQIFSGTYTPTSTARWASAALITTNETADVHVEWCVVRERSTRNTGALADQDTADFASDVAGSEKPSNNANQTLPESTYTAAAVTVTDTVAWTQLATDAIDPGSNDVYIFFSMLGGPTDARFEIRVRNTTASTTLVDFTHHIDTVNNIVSFAVSDTAPAAGSNTYVVEALRTSGFASLGASRRSIMLMASK